MGAEQSCENGGLHAQETVAYGSYRCVHCCSPSNKPDRSTARSAAGRSVGQAVSGIQGSASARYEGDGDSQTRSLAGSSEPLFGSRAAETGGTAARGRIAAVPTADSRADEDFRQPLFHRV